MAGIRSSYEIHEKKYGRKEGKPVSSEESRSEKFISLAVSLTGRVKMADP